MVLPWLVKTDRSSSSFHQSLVLTESTSWHGTVPVDVASDRQTPHGWGCRPSRFVASWGRQMHCQDRGLDNHPGSDRFQRPGWFLFGCDRKPAFRAGGCL